MKQFTLRGFDAELEERLRREARREGLSLNQVAMRFLRRGAGLAEGSNRADTVGRTLDHLAGTWTELDAREFAAALVPLQSVDEAFWGRPARLPRGRR